MILKNIGGKLVLCPDLKDQIKTVDVSSDLKKGIPIFKKYVTNLTLYVIVGQLQVIGKESTSDIIHHIFINDLNSLVNHFNFFLVEVSRSVSNHKMDEQLCNNLIITKKEKCGVETLIRNLKHVRSNEVFNLNDFYTMFAYSDKLNINRNCCIDIAISVMITFYRNMTKMYNICEITNVLKQDEFFNDSKKVYNFVSSLLRIDE